MPLQLKNTVLKEFLRVEISGQRTPGQEVLESRKIWNQVALICREKKIEKVLAFMKVEGRLPIDSAFQIAESARVIGWSLNYKLAVVASDEALNMNIQLSETILTNLGYEMKLFSNGGSAKKWLLKDY